MTQSATHAAIEAVFRIEWPKLIAGLTRVVRDVGVAEELAHDALVAALEQWPNEGIPDKPGAWLMATAKHRAIDTVRRNKLVRRKHEELGREIEAEGGDLVDEREALDAALDDEIGDDLLSLMFISCHPVLAMEARVALTLRMLGGLTTTEIARAFLVPEATIAQRIVRAKRTLAEARVPFEVPRGDALAERLASVLEVVYLVFNEGYSATAGSDWLRPALCEDALKLARMLAELAPGRARGARPRRAARDSSVAHCGSDRPRRRARAVARAGPQPLGSIADSARARGARARRALGRCARPVRTAGRDRGVPCACGDG